MLLPRRALKAIIFSAFGRFGRAIRMNLIGWDWMATSPDTKIPEFPKNPTLEITASFKFSSTKPNSIFYCSLDDADFVPCEENTNYEKTYENLFTGEHILKVQAKDEFGNIDKTPEEYSWTIEKAESAPHLVISEIAAGVGNASNEFIELYNPTDFSLNLKEQVGLKIKLVNSSGIEINKQITWINNTISSHRYFLIGSGSLADINLDATYGGELLTGVSGVIVLDKDNNVIDKVGWGEKPPGEKLAPIVASEGQGIEIDQSGGLKTGQSLERKFNEFSTAESLANGADEFLGNGWDTDDNSADFVLRSAPNPQNSASIAEPAPTPAHNISSGLDYPSIQWAIDSASAGDKIWVDSGTYYENVNINKQLTLEGIDTGGGKPVVDAKGKGRAITLSADGITLEGFSAINTANASGEWPIAGILVKSQKNIIKNNTVNSNDNGIVLYYSNNNELAGNEAFDNSNGIYLDHSIDNNLSNNTTNSNNNGIVIASDGNNIFGNNILSDNTADSNDRGIYLLYASGNTITDNSADSNFYGIYLGSNSKNNIIKGNTLSYNNIGPSSAGIYFYSDSNYNTITGNNISDNSFGFNIYYSAGNIIYHNNIKNNTNQVYDNVGNGNIWDDGYPSGGNYWSDYAGENVKKGASQNEAGSDGIGDTPYIVIGYGDKVLVQDRYPLMQ
ncbi:right-handed parallel beta-helix repeat-containing protein [Patescibacteria group bacterium]|nr:right-handed parallel beta-helix repeat-containing protein [Patescibacteria group bacterium]